jgi:hypothetical protein
VSLKLATKSFICTPITPYMVSVELTGVFTRESTPEQQFKARNRVHEYIGTL